MLHTRGEYQICDEPGRLDRKAMHTFLSQAYWSPGIPRAVVDRAVAASLNFGLYHGDAQVGYARLVTDRATFAWLCDVYVSPEHRGQGLGRWLVETVVAQPDLQHVRRILLATADAHQLYADYGFASLREPQRFMAIERSPDQLYAHAADEDPHTDCFSPLPLQAQRAATGELRVRLAGHGDAGDVARLLDQLGYPSTADEVAARLSYWLSDSASRILVAEQEDYSVGVLAFHLIPLLEKTGWRCRIESLVVDSEVRGAGIGRLLLTAAERHAAECGCLDVEVTSSRDRDDAHAFYRRFGYVDVCDKSGRFIKELPSTSHGNGVPVR